MIQVICDFCGHKVMKEFVHKVKIEPWYDPKMVGHVYRRDFDCCTECAKAIEHRLIMIENNRLWHGKDPNRRYKNWGMPEPTKEQVKEYCRKRCLSIISNEFMAHIIADNGESIKYKPTEGWIPCSERKPEKDGLYIVWEQYEPPGYRITIERFINGHWGVKTPISAWMPLPEPYKNEYQEVDIVKIEDLERGIYTVEKGMIADDDK